MVYVVSAVKELPYFSGYKTQPPQIWEEMGVSLIVRM